MLSDSFALLAALRAAPAAGASAVSGSPVWQTIFVSFAVMLMLFQIARGWRLGLPRQLVRIGAILAAYSAALFGGGILVPLLRPLIKVPDFVISALGGAILALVVYSIVNTIGTILFKRTGQQNSGLVRLVYGVSGAVLGIFFGLFFLWVLITGIRSVGALAEAQVSASTPGPPVAVDDPQMNLRTVRQRKVAPPPTDDGSLAVSMARLKKSIELGSVGDFVRQTDVLPAGIYQTLAKVGEVFAKPESASRFLAYPGVAELAETPQLLALRADPQVTRMIEQGRIWELLQDERLIEATNDPELARRLKKFDLRKALDYAAKEREEVPHTKAHKGEEK
ncbi:MAG: CvpA family protein [Chthoniobacterales bacterium]